MSAVIHEGLNKPVVEEIELVERNFSNLPPAAKINSLIDDRYEYQGVLLGRGANAKVVKAFDTHTEQNVAIKLPKIASERDMKRFQREVELTAGFTEMGQSVPKFIGAGVHKGDVKQYAYMATEIKAGSLTQKIKATPEGLSIEGIVKATRPAFATIETAHLLGILHRDLKPDNLLLDEEGYGCVADWGIAAPTRGLAYEELEHYHLSPDVISASLDEPGSFDGAIIFAAPELLRGAPYSTSSEVFAVGVILYMLQSKGKAPWGEHTDIDSYAENFQGRARQPIDLVHYGASPDDPLKQITDRCLAVDPAYRVKDIREVNEVLDSI